MYAFNKEIPKLDANNLILNENQKIEELSDEFILINPYEINEFCLKKSNLIDLINASSSLIHNYFPDSKIYLEYKDDPEYDDFDAIFAYIINNKNTILENNRIYNELLDEFIKEKKSFPSLYSYYYINVYNDDDIIRNYKMSSKV